MIDPGKMRHRITFQEFDGEEDGFGDPLEADDSHWNDVTTTWAAIDPISGREFYAAEQSQSEVSHKFRLRCWRYCPMWRKATGRNGMKAC